MDAGPAAFSIFPVAFALRPLPSWRPVPDTSAPRVPFWSLIAAGAALVLGLALLKDQKARKVNLDVAANAPKVSLTRLDGKTQSVTAGQVTLVDFWATWCAPCRASMPRVEHVFHDYTPKGVTLFSINTDSDSADRDPTVREFLMANSLDFPVALDNGAAQDAFHVSVLPTMHVVGKRGGVVWSHTGAMGANEERELRRVLDEALAEK
jgi:thiol-disulfide isomerase/thioredoxin